MIGWDSEMVKNNDYVIVDVNSSLSLISPVLVQGRSNCSYPPSCRDLVEERVEREDFERVTLKGTSMVLGTY